MSAFIFAPASQRRQFLRFVWGRSRLPPRGADAGRALELQPFARAAAARLPTRPPPTLPLTNASVTNSTAEQQNRLNVLVDAAATAASESDASGGSEALAITQPPKVPATTATVQFQVCGAAAVHC